MAEQSERELMIDFLKVELEYYQAQLPYRDKVRQLREKMLAAWQGQTHSFRHEAAQPPASAAE